MPKPRSLPDNINPPPSATANGYPRSAMAVPRTSIKSIVTTDAARPENHLKNLMLIKYGPESRRGWGPRLRERFEHYTPDDWYEAFVSGLVTQDTEWLDVGGGDRLFAANDGLARILANRCRRLVVVDPASNIQMNPYADKRVQLPIEEFSDSGGFDLATVRMVAEHVEKPREFTARLGELVRPGGKVVVYTVSLGAPVTLLSAMTPVSFHRKAKRFLWQEMDDDHTYPVIYRMNTRSSLRKLFAAAGFREAEFRYLDDCRVLGRWQATLTAELILCRMFRSIGLHYPEKCLLGIYQKAGGERDVSVD